MGNDNEQNAQAQRPLLRITDLVVRYGPITAVRGVSLDIYPGEFVALIGSNGAGKSTILRAISGLQSSAAGTIEFNHRNVRAMEPSTIVKAGIVHCPEGRHIFTRLTVQENLRLGFYSAPKASDLGAALKRIYNTFPILKEKRDELAATLSGGQQQMLALGRSLMLKPALLMLDEPSLGLAPLVITQIFKIIAKENASGTAILLVEQNANLALKSSSRAYVLESGKVVVSGHSGKLLRSDLVRRAYLGEL